MWYYIYDIQNWRKYMNGNNVNEQIKKQKKTIIIVFLCLVGFVLLYFLLSIVDWNSMFKSENPSKDKDYIYFYYLFPNISK